MLVVTTTAKDVAKDGILHMYQTVGRALDRMALNCWTKANAAIVAVVMYVCVDVQSAGIGSINCMQCSAMQIKIP